MYGVVPYTINEIRRHRLHDGGFASCFEQLGRVFLDLVELDDLQRVRLEHQRSRPLGGGLDPAHALLVAADVAD